MDLRVDTENALIFTGTKRKNTKNYFTFLNEVKAIFIRNEKINAKT